MKHLVAGTAGHIDHGKSALVKALTGIEMDRLPEEKRRGISIELGYAFLDLPDGTRVGIVDVPGHERFVRTMVAGATGIDFAILVVAADDSVMPQTREHLAILNLLGVRDGLVALNKTDLVEADMAELVAEEIRDMVAGTFLANARIVPVSSITGAGIEELKAAIAEVAARVPERTVGALARVPIDRSFAIAQSPDEFTDTMEGPGGRQTTFPARDPKTWGQHTGHQTALGGGTDIPYSRGSHSLRASFGEEPLPERLAAHGQERGAGSVRRQAAGIDLLPPGLLPGRQVQVAVA